MVTRFLVSDSHKSVRCCSYTAPSTFQRGLIFRNSQRNNIENWRCTKSIRDAWATKAKDILDPLAQKPPSIPVSPVPKPMLVPTFKERSSQKELDSYIIFNSIQPFDRESLFVADTHRKNLISANNHQANKKTSSPARIWTAHFKSGPAAFRLSLTF